VPGQPLFGGASPPPGAADDVRFLSDLVGDLAARYCIDRSRVYARRDGPRTTAAPPRR